MEAVQSLKIRENLRARALLKDAIRRFFNAQDYLECDTPIAVPAPGTEVHLHYFRTEWDDAAGECFPLWLRSSPEIHMKQVLATGLERIFQFAPCFRNGGERSPWHNPEFTMLEWYQAGIGFDAYIQQTVDLLRYTREEFVRIFPAADGHCTLPETFQRYTVAEAFLEFAGLELRDNDPDLVHQARAKKIPSIQAHDDFETAFFKILIDKVEPGLARLGAAILSDYPPSQAALARVEGGTARRFEIYVGRIELCNGFYELLDAEANVARIDESNLRRAALHKEANFDFTAFYDALRSGIPACCGNALGFDRWLAILLGESDLANVIPFQEMYRGSKVISAG